jgi:hypothetical protein
LGEGITTGEDNLVEYYGVECNQGAMVAGFLDQLEEEEDIKGSKVQPVTPAPLSFYHR